MKGAVLSGSQPAGQVGPLLPLPQPEVGVPLALRKALPGAPTWSAVVPAAMRL